MDLSASKREPGKAAQARQQGHIPGVVYNKEVNVPVSVELRAFDKVFRSQGTSNIIDLNIEGDEKREVLVKAVQMDKRRRVPQHVDFYAVTAGQTVQVAVSIELTGTPVGVKEGGLMDVQRREINIEILPRLIPSALHVDVSELTIGDSLHISDIADRLPAEAEILDDVERTIVTIVPPRVEAEPEEAAADEITEPEVIGESQDNEGEGEDAGENDE